MLRLRALSLGEEIWFSWKQLQKGQVYCTFEFLFSILFLGK